MKEIDNILGIEHIDESNQEILPPVVVEEEKAAPQKPVYEDTADRQEDYDLSRRTFRDLIEKGNDAIEGISDLAKQSDSPRAYEVMATLIKTVADTTKDLYDLQKKTKDLTTGGEKKVDEAAITVEKAVFVGTTADLLKKVKNTNNVK